MKLSQYTNDYLAGNLVRGSDKGITIGSYLAYTLRGAAKRYSGSYARSLERSVRLVGAVQGRSAGGRVAWYPAS